MRTHGACRCVGRNVEAIAPFFLKCVRIKCNLAIIQTKMLLINTILGGRSTTLDFTVVIAYIVQALSRKYLDAIKCHLQLVHPIHIHQLICILDNDVNHTAKSKIIV